MEKKPSILVTLDSMKNPNTGLYYFGKSLGLELLKIQLKNNDFDTTYYVPKKGSDVFEGEVKTIRHSEWYKYFFPHSRKFNLVHFTDQICRLSPLMVTAKKIITIHDLNFVYENDASSAEFKKNFDKIKIITRSCDRIVAISKYVAKDLIQHFPEVESKIEVIYNGADKLLHSETHLPILKPSKPFIFSLGELLAKKNFHVLPALLRNNKYQLVIAGNRNSTKYDEQITKAARDAGVEDRLSILGPVSDLDKAWYYANCSAFAFPSIAEGFGLPIIEAMHFGKPVFLSTRTAVPEIGGEAAFYFKSFDPESMSAVFSEGMELYRNDPAIKLKLIDRANQFSWHSTAIKYYELYQRMLS